MKNLLGGAFLVASIAVAGSSSGTVPPNVHIAYPIPGSPNSNYFKVSFTVTCQGGQNGVKWGFDGSSVGSATFYDNFNSQFLHKLPTGWHTVDVSASCGQDQVRFFVN